MTELLFDMIPALDGTRDVYTVILFGPGGGACPQIPKIEPELFFTRLKAELNGADRSITRLRNYLGRDDRLINERMEWASKEQLRAVGFEGR